MTETNVLKSLTKFITVGNLRQTVRLQRTLAFCACVTWLSDKDSSDSSVFNDADKKYRKLK